MYFIERVKQDHKKIDAIKKTFKSLQQPRTKSELAAALKDKGIFQTKAAASRYINTILREHFKYIHGGKL